MALFLLQVGISQSFAGELVKKAQQSLVEKGLNPGPVDGLWGPKTKKAIMKFQKMQGLVANGKLNDVTKRSLFASEAVSPWKAKPAGSWNPFDVDPSEIAEDPTKVKTIPAHPKQTTQIKKAIKAPLATPKPTSKPAKMAAPSSPKPTIAKPTMSKATKMVKASGVCPQPRKTKSAPSNIARLDKTPSANLDRGKSIYLKTAKPMACKICHGDNGDGGGKLGKTLKPKPRNFSCSDTMEKVSAGQMFWIIKNGSPGTGMVAHKKSLKDSDIWDVVKYIRSTFMHATSTGEKTVQVPEPVPAPIETKPAPEVAPTILSKPKAMATLPAKSMISGKLPSGFKVPSKYNEETVSNGGSISGVIHFSGNVPAPIMEDLSKGKNVEFCSTHPDAKGNIRPRIKVSATAGKLKDAVVFIQNIEKGKAWSKEVINFDFRACDIFPKVSVVRKTPKGMKTGLLTITNQDPDVLHNPHGYSVVGASRKTLFNKPLPSKGDLADVTRSFKRFKSMKDKHFFLQCDQHNFMEANAKVIWNPYYSITGAEGSFKIDQIPAGRYWVTAWHPYVGEVSGEVVVAGGVEQKIDFELKPQ
jgi:peptidoglycan hydrolase-like protein with peptidoglycan-binding domain